MCRLMYCRRNRCSTAAQGIRTTQKPTAGRQCRSRALKSFCAVASIRVGDPARLDRTSCWPMISLWYLHERQQALGNRASSWLRAYMAVVSLATFPNVIFADTLRRPVCSAEASAATWAVARLTTKVLHRASGKTAQGCMRRKPSCVQHCCVCAALLSVHSCVRVSPTCPSCAHSAPRWRPPARCSGGMRPAPSAAASILVSEPVSGG